MSPQSRRGRVSSSDVSNDHSSAAHGAYQDGGAHQDETSVAVTSLKVGPPCDERVAGASGVCQGPGQESPALTRLILFHPMDHRGQKLGGIETHVRLVLARHPETTSVLLVGVDEIGDCKPGRVYKATFEGRSIDFLPVMRADPSKINTSAQQISQSMTLRFLLAALRHLPNVRRIIRGQRVSCEIQRNEFAILPKLLRLPCVLLVHNGGTREDKMDSLLKRYWFLHRLNERLALEAADRVFAVSEAIAAHISSLSGRYARKVEVLSVSVNTLRFRPSPFQTTNATFRVCFAGRLDAFKDPPMMFASLTQLAKRIAAAPAREFEHLAFDYVGASDPAKFAEFGPIAPLTIIHGIKSAAEVANIMGAAHAGVITSFFEGMPCYLLEMLASGRPVVALALPQFAPLIHRDRSGALVPRSENAVATARALSDALYTLAEDIAAGRLIPGSMSELVQPYSVDRQMARLFEHHTALAAGPKRANAAAAVA